jgi:cytochrome P450
MPYRARMDEQPAIDAAPEGHAGPHVLPLPPLISGWPVLGVAPALLRRGPDVLVDLARAHGTPLRVAMGPSGSVLVAEPDHVRHVLVDHAASYVRGRSVDLVRPMLGNGLPLSDGPDWLRQRRTMQPLFGRARLEAMIRALGRVAERHADGLVPGSTVQADDLFMRLTRDAIVDVMFSDSIGNESQHLDSALADIEHYVGRYALLPVRIPLGLPTPDNRRFRRAIGILDRLVYGLIERRRVEGAAASATGDLLDALLAARDPETGDAMPDRLLRDEVLNIFYAGHETTAKALTWTIAYLSTEPAVAARIREELQRTLGGRTPAAADLPSLAYTSAVVREVLRLRPPAWIIGRVAMRDDVIGSYRVPAGSIVLLAPYVTHRLAAHWPDPERFDPERFLRDPALGTGGGRTPYIPFGAGGHQCIGNHLAMAEALVFLAVLLQRFELRADPSAPVRPAMGATLGIVGGLRVQVGLVA